MVVFNVPHPESPSSENLQEWPSSENPLESLRSRICTPGQLSSEDPLASPSSRTVNRSGRTLSVLQLSHRDSGTARSETESSVQTLRDRRFQKRAAAGRRASTGSTAHIGTESQWDGDMRRWKRFLRDVELYLETEKLDVDFFHGARWLSRLTGSDRKYAETIELDKLQRSVGENKDTRGGMIAGVKYLLKSLESHWYWESHEERTTSGALLQETHMTSQRHREWGASHEDRRVEGVVQEYGLASFRERNFERQKRV